MRCEMQIKIVPLMNITEKPVLVSLYAAVDSFHDIKEEEMVRLVFASLSFSVCSLPRRSLSKDLVIVYTL